MAASSFPSSSRQDGLKRLESTVASHLQSATSSRPSFVELVSSITDVWTTLGTEIELESTEGTVKDPVKDILLRVIRDDALAAAVRP